jgi:hypothetical protein
MPEPLYLLQLHLRVLDYFNLFFQCFFLLSQIYIRKEKTAFEKHTVPNFFTSCVYMKTAEPHQGDSAVPFVIPVFLLVVLG